MTIAMNGTEETVMIIIRTDMAVVEATGSSGNQMKKEHGLHLHRHQRWTYAQEVRRHMNLHRNHSQKIRVTVTCNTWSQNRAAYPGCYGKS